MFGLQYEEAPTVDTFAGMLSIDSRPVYALVDMGATHSCISNECVFECGLSSEVLSEFSLCVSTPLGLGTSLRKVVKSVDMEIEGLHMPIDMLVLPMLDFDVVLGMN